MTTRRHPQPLAFALAFAVALTIGCQSAETTEQPDGDAPPKSDPAEIITAPAIYPLYDDIAPGHWSEVTTTLADGKTISRRIAVVGKSAGLWRIEVTDSGDGGLIRGLEVKDDGAVASAFIGRPGAPARPIPVAPAPATTDVRPRGSAPKAGVEETVEVGAGKLKSRRITTTVGDGEEVVRWIGAEGDARGLLIKTTGPAGSYALASLERTELVLDGTTFQCLVAVYDDGREVWRSERWAHFAGNVLRLVDPEALTIELTGYGEDAKPALTWPR